MFNEPLICKLGSESLLHSNQNGWLAVAYKIGHEVFWAAAIGAACKRGDIKFDKQSHTIGSRFLPKICISTTCTKMEVLFLAKGPVIAESLLGSIFRSPIADYFNDFSHCGDLDDGFTVSDIRLISETVVVVTFALKTSKHRQLRERKITLGTPGNYRFVVRDMKSDPIHVPDVSSLDELFSQHIQQPTLTEPQTTVLPVPIPYAETSFASSPSSTDCFGEAPPVLVGLQICGTPFPVSEQDLCFLHEENPFLIPELERQTVESPTSDLLELYQSSSACNQEEAFSLYNPEFTTDSSSWSFETQCEILNKNNSIDFSFEASTEVVPSSTPKRNRDDNFPDDDPENSHFNIFRKLE
jgi:hypothetical protein